MNDVISKNDFRSHKEMNGFVFVGSDRTSIDFILKLVVIIFLLNL
jgi:hypothetical protein